MGIHADITFNGPVFDQYETDIATERARQDTEDALQDAVYERVKTLGQSRFRYVDKSNHHVPGKWLHSIRKTREGDLPAVDTGIIYGYWLEGIGSRNFPKTRFRGYRMWRETTQMIQSEAEKIAQPHIDRAVERLNG
jgi:hypothetical protein